MAEVRFELGASQFVTWLLKHYATSTLQKLQKGWYEINNSTFLHNQVKILAQHASKTLCPSFTYIPLAADSREFEVSCKNWEDNEEIMDLKKLKKLP